MADSIYKWALAAASNDAADSAINWRENQLPDTVNDSNRAMMMRIAEWREDMTGGLLTTGTQPAYALTSKAAFDSLANGRFITVRIHATNTAAATLNVNALGAKAIRKYGTSGDLPIVSGDLQLNGLYQFMYSTVANAGAGAWIISNPSAGPSGSFASGTAMLFTQAAAPAGWTLSATHNNKSLRVVNTAAGGSGGTTAFTSVFTSRTVSTPGFALATANLPVHAHSFADSSSVTGGVSVNHTHTFADASSNTGNESVGHTHQTLVHNQTTTAMFPGGSYGVAATPSDQYLTSTDRSAGHYHAVGVSGTTGANSVSHTHTVAVSGTSGNAGSGTAHTHPDVAVDFAVQYVDAMIATKD